jgi:hypothetical protein
MIVVVFIENNDEECPEVVRRGITPPWQARIIADTILQN